MNFSNVEYRDVMSLSFWDKNQAVREISEENWNKLVADIQRHGIIEPFKIDNNNNVYDGNNRLKALRQIIAEGKIASENNKDLTKVPVIIYNPQTEAEKWEIALKGNEQFATWNQEGLMNYLPEFENELDLSLINIAFYEPESINDQLTEEDEANYDNNKKEIICPACGHKFIP